MLAAAFSLYRRHFAALALTGALSLVPANLLAAGAVVFGLASLGSGGVAEGRTQTQRMQDRQPDLQERSPPTAEAREARVRQIGREAVDGASGFELRQYFRDLVPIAYATAIVAAVLLAGLFLAHAAIVPLVVDLSAGRPAGPAHAWAVAGSRIGALLGTALLAAPLVAMGAVFFFVPGIVLATGFSLAAPIVVLERVSGRDALERSWRLLRGHWGEALVFWALIVLFSVLASAASARFPPGPWRPLVSALVRVVLYPLPLVGLVLLYQRALSTSGGSRPRDSSGRGSPGSPSP